MTINSTLTIGKEEIEKILSEHLTKKGYILKGKFSYTLGYEDEYDRSYSTISCASIDVTNEPRLLEE